MARLAYSTLGVHIFSRSVNEWHTVLSRVMEKSANYTLAALWMIFEARPDLASYKHIVIWADGGSNMKCSQVIATVSFDMLSAYGWKSTRFEYGCPKHFKSSIDAHFGVLSYIRRSAAMKEMLSEVDDIKRCYDRHFDSQAAIHSDAKHVAYNFQPPEKRTVRVSRYTRPSLGGVRHAFSWTVLRNDDRRRSLRGRSVELHWTLTGLTLRNNHATGKRSGHQSFPILDNGGGRSGG